MVKYVYTSLDSIWTNNVFIFLPITIWLLGKHGMEDYFLGIGLELIY